MIVNEPIRTRPARAETRRRVLDAAFAVFGERGIAASSLAEVARAAGLTKGAVYSNFRGKDDLVLALMEEHAMHRLSSALAGITPTTDVDEALAMAAAVLVRSMHDGAAWHWLLAEYFALSHHDPDRREGLRLRRQEARDAVARAMTRVAETTEIRLPLPAPDLATVLFALSNGMAMESAIDPEGVSDDLLGSVLTLMFATPSDHIPRPSSG